MKVYVFKSLPQFLWGYTRDLRVMWALEECEITYETHGLDCGPNGLQDEVWFESISPDFIVKENDVLVNSTGDGTIGRSAIAHKEVDGYVFDSHILKISSIISQMYLCYYINSNYGQEQVNKSKGATSTKQHELGVNNLSNFTIPLPPLSEQKRIVAEIEKQLAKTKQLKEHIIANQQATEQLLKTLLHQAFEVGEIKKSKSRRD